VTEPVFPKPDRNKRHVKMRPISNTAWWTEFTAELLAFVLAGPTRSWTEINAWCRARWYTAATIENMIAFLDLSKKMAIVSLPDSLTLWGAPPPPEPCRACRAENETGQQVKDVALHSCGRGKKERAA